MKKQINASVFQESLTQAGLNASALAKEIGVSREAVSRWQKGESFPRPDKLLRLGMILNQPYQALVVQEPMAVHEPQVAYRAKANRKTKIEHVVWAKEAGTRLRELVPYLPFDRTHPPVLKAPRVDYNYAQEIATEVRGQMGIPKSGKIEIQHFLDQFMELDAVLIPVFWGEQKQHGQALHAYLPDSMTTWVWLDLDTKLHDFKFLMAHELGHAYSPSLTDDEAEDFADLFAQCLLCPHEVTLRAYSTLARCSTVAERWSVVESIARRRLISPYTVMKALNAYAEHAGKSEIDFGKYGPKLTRFNKSVKSVAQLLFKGKHPEPAEYIQSCSKAFGTPFFGALEALGKTEGLAPPLLAKTMDLSLIDAKAICQELVGMPPPKLFILDSNAYFRLAYSLHPLLGQQFGKSTTERYVLRVISQLDKEYSRSARLQHKFHWVKDKKFSENRKTGKLNIAGKQCPEVEQARTYILSEEKNLGCNISLVDATALAIGFVKQQPVVTDDKDMCTVAAALGIEVWSLLQVLKLMLDEEHVDLDKVKEIAQFLDYENDLPCGRTMFVKQFKQFFYSTPFD